MFYSFLEFGNKIFFKPRIFLEPDIISRRGVWKRENFWREFFPIMNVSGKDTSHQKSLMLVGPKRCGKGTIGRVMKELVGAQNTCSPTFSGLSSHFGLANLINKQLAIISDARLSNRTDTTVLVENILRITGEDSVSVARKYLSDWDGKLSTRFVIMTNLVPALSESSGALAGRLIILKIKTSFYGKEDLSLTERLLTELPSILNWSLEGLDRLRARRHLIQPSSATQYLEQLDTLSSPIKFFVSENCVVTPPRWKSPVRAYSIDGDLGVSSKIATTLVPFSSLAEI